MNSYRFIEPVWTIVMVIIIALMTYALVGCGQVRCDKPVVTLQRPVLPTVSAEAVQSLSDETYATLVDRELRLREYGEQCEAIVKEMTQ